MCKKGYLSILWDFFQRWQYLPCTISWWDILTAWKTPLKFKCWRISLEILWLGNEYFHSIFNKCSANFKESTQCAWCSSIWKLLAHVVSIHLYFWGISIRFKTFISRHNEFKPFFVMFMMLFQNLFFEWKCNVTLL